MPSRDRQHRVKDVLAAIAEIREFTNGIAFDEVQGDRETIRAVLYNLALIGEAVRAMPPEVEALHPEIPWGASHLCKVGIQVALIPQPLLPNIGEGETY